MTTLRRKLREAERNDLLGRARTLEGDVGTLQWAASLPAKAGNEMLSIILHEARDHLREGGRFYVVTISGLKDYIKRNFREVFGNYKKVKQGKTYTVSLAVRE